MRNGSDSLVLLKKEDRDAAASVLEEAFKEYELLRYYFPEKKQRYRIARTFCCTALSVCLKYGEVYATSPGMEGIAGWFPPGKSPFGSREVLRSVPLTTLIKSCFNGISRMMTYDRYLTRIHHELIPEPHWYLHILGVNPVFRSQGFSSRLIRPVLERADSGNMPCFVETHSITNVQIYSRFGFSVVKEAKIPGTDLTSFAMIRKAKT